MTEEEYAAAYQQQELLQQHQMANAAQMQYMNQEQADASQYVQDIIEKTSKFSEGQQMEEEEEEYGEEEG